MQYESLQYAIIHRLPSTLRLISLSIPGHSLHVRHVIADTIKDRRHKESGRRQPAIKDKTKIFTMAVIDGWMGVYIYVCVCVCVTMQGITTVAHQRHIYPSGNDYALYAPPSITFLPHTPPALDFVSRYVRPKTGGRTHDRPHDKAIDPFARPSHSPNNHGYENFQMRMMVTSKQPLPLTLSCTAPRFKTNVNQKKNTE